MQNHVSLPDLFFPTSSIDFLSYALILLSQLVSLNFSKWMIRQKLLKYFEKTAIYALCISKGADLSIMVSFIKKADCIECIISLSID